jgi:hypothetical protein
MSEPSKVAELRQCIYCRKTIRHGVARCPYCREAQTDAPATKNSQPFEPGNSLRNGLLLILLAATAHYLAFAHRPSSLPAQVVFPVVTYLVPLLYASGLGVTLYGVFQRMRA